MDTADFSASTMVPPEEEEEFLQRCSWRKRWAMVRHKLPVSEAKAEELQPVRKHPRRSYRKKNRPTSQHVERSSDWNEVSQVDIIEYEFTEWA
eukprot:g27063.t1